MRARNTGKARAPRQAGRSSVMRSGSTNLTPLEVFTGAVAWKASSSWSSAMASGNATMLYPDARRPAREPMILTAAVVALALASVQQTAPDDDPVRVALYGRPLDVGIA